jgi:hypothetical protein
MLLGLGEFHEKRRTEGHAFLTDINEITFTRVP